MLQEDATLAALPIRPDVLDDADVLPGLIYEINAITSVECLAGPTGQFEGRVLIDCIARTRSQAEELDALVRVAMNTSGTFAGTTIESSGLVGIGDEVGWRTDGDETAVYRTSSDFKLLFRPA